MDRRSGRSRALEVQARPRSDRQTEDHPDGEYGRFAVEVPYNINSITNALVVVTEGEPGIDGVTYLSSVEIMLSP